MDLLIVLSLFLGILLALFMYKYMIKRPQLSLFIVVLPFIVLGLLSAPSLYPQLEKWRMTYSWGMMAFLLTYILKERAEKKAKIEK
jgi:hypothetical protein